jgi:hypothetical protein
LSLSDAHKPCAETQLLRALIKSCRGPSPPSRTTVEEALEKGFGRLMALEGRLQQRQASHTAGARGSEMQSHDDGLVEEIQILREALDELRTRTTSGAISPLAGGFVLPRGRTAKR